MPKYLIPKVTVSTLDAIEFDDFLDAMEPYLLEDIPEGTLNGNPDAMPEIDRLIGRLANLHAYVVYLWAYSSARAAYFKRAGLDDEWNDMLRKKESLYAFKGALKQKWEACSRMVTINQGEEEDDHINYRARAESVKRSPKRTGGGWGHVG